MDHPRNSDQAGGTASVRDLLAAIEAIEETPDHEVAALSQEESQARRAEVTALLARFPAGERDAARAGLYLDADGRLATRHRLLRGL